MGTDNISASRSLRPRMCHGRARILRVTGSRGDWYGKIAGRREWARVLLELGSITPSAGADIVELGRDSKERSSMKFPAARLFGVRGRCSTKFMSYGCCGLRELLSSLVVACGYRASPYCRWRVTSIASCGT